MPKEYNILIKFDPLVGGQDPPEFRPGVVISAGFTDFSAFSITDYLVITEPKATHTKKILKASNKFEHDTWHVTKLVRVTRNQADIDTADENFILSSTPGTVIAWQRVTVKNNVYWQPLYSEPIT